MAFTRLDLGALNTVYWEIEGRGKAWEAHAKALSRIYYACEAMLDKSDIIKEPPQAEISDSVLVEEDTTTYEPKHKQRDRVHRRVSEAV